MRSIKTLGLATVVAMALVALVGAASASAKVFKSETVSTSLSAKNVKSTSLQLDGETWTCNVERISFSTSLPTGSASELIAHTWNPGCVFLGQESTWDYKFCNYTINAPTGESMQGTIDMTGCEALVYDRQGGLSCHVEIPSQTLGPVEFVNEGSGTTKTIKLVLAIKEITYTRTGAGCFGPVGTFSNGKYSGEWSISGTGAGQQVSVWVDKESPPPTHFSVESKPAFFSGQLATSSPAGFYLYPVTAISCKKYTLNGETESAAPETLFLTPSYGECKFTSGSSGQVVSTSMGSCSYAYHVSGKLDIIGGAACESNPITIKGELWGQSCTITIGPQTGLSGLNYAAGGSGSTRYITSNGKAEGLTFTVSGKQWELCPQYGTFNNSGFVGLSSYTMKLTATTLFKQPQGLWLE